MYKPVKLSKGQTKFFEELALARAKEVVEGFDGEGLLWEIEGYLLEQINQIIEMKASEAYRQGLSDTI